jgi:hypothetical protein
VIAAGAERERIGRLAQESEPGAVGRCDLFEQRAVAIGVGAGAGKAERGVALDLGAAGKRHALAHLRTSFGRLRQNEVGGGDGRHLDLKVDAVEQGAGDARLVALGAGPALAADIARLARAAAAAGIHRGDELDPRWVGDAVVRPRDHRLAVFERLAQRIENLRIELGQLVDARARLRPGVAACRRRRAPPCSPSDAGRGRGACG